MEDEEIIERANKLARTFYSTMGYQASEDHRFYEATHPQEAMMWDFACIAMNQLLKIDPDDIV